MAISVGSPGAAKELAGRLGLGFPVLADPSLGVTKAYGVVEEGKSHPRPATFVLDADRRVVFRHLGRNAADRPELGEVLAALEALSDAR